MIVRLGKALATNLKKLKFNPFKQLKLNEKRNGGTDMSFKTLIKKTIVPGMKISVDHVNGLQYEGEVIDTDATNPSDFTIVIEDEEDRYLMNVGAEMGVIRISKKELSKSEDGNSNDETMMSEDKPTDKPHEPKPKKDKLSTVKVPPKKKSKNTKFKDIHAPR
jgi:hypothetical protein